MTADSIQSAERQRVSCAALCIINDAQGRYLLGINRARLAHGKRIYTPIGGALTYRDTALLTRFSAIPENPAGRDLRLSIPAGCMDAFRAWFRGGSGRETTPLRELREELVQEFGIIDALTPRDVMLQFVHTHESQSLSDRHGAQTVATHYFQDIFCVRFRQPSVRRRLEAAAPDSGLRWFTRRELEQGRSDDGARLNAAMLLGQ